MPKISALPPAGTLDDDDETPFVDDSVSTTKKFTLSGLRTWLQSLVGWITTTMLADGAVTPGKLAAPVAFRAHPSTAQSMSGSTTTILNFGTELYDYGDNFASSTFTAPYDGIYHFDAACSIGSERRIFLSMTVNNNEKMRSFDGSGVRSVLLSGDLNLSAGDEVKVGFFNSGSATNNLPNEYVTYFNGHLVGIV